MSRWMVVAEFNTDADGSPVPDDAHSWPRCLYGPFANEPEAVEWMNHGYPDDDTDLHDMWATPLMGEDTAHLNPPETVTG